MNSNTKWKFLAHYKLKFTAKIHKQKQLLLSLIWHSLTRFSWCSELPLQYVVGFNNCMPWKIKILQVYTRHMKAYTYIAWNENIMLTMTTAITCFFFFAKVSCELRVGWKAGSHGQPSWDSASFVQGFHMEPTQPTPSSNPPFPCGTHVRPCWTCWLGTFFFNSVV